MLMVLYICNHTHMHEFIYLYKWRYVCNKSCRSLPCIHFPLRAFFSWSFRWAVIFCFAPFRPLKSIFQENLKLLNCLFNWLLMFRTFTKQQSCSSYFQLPFSYLLVFCATFLAVSMTIILRIRGRFALGWCFAKLPLLLPIWESDFRSSWWIQCFIFISPVCATSTIEVLQATVIYIALCILPWKYNNSEGRAISSSKGAAYSGWWKRTHHPQKDNSPVQPGLVPARMKGGWEEQVCAVCGCCLAQTWASAQPHPSCTRFLTAAFLTAELSKHEKKYFEYFELYIAYLIIF